MTAKPAINRAQAIDILRALAALAVVTYHVWLYRLPNPSRPSREGWFEYLIFEMRIGLVVFLVMTGYLLYRPLVRDGAVRPIKIGRYYWRRIVRIVPGYYLSMIGAIVLLWGLSGTAGVRIPDASDLWMFALFLQNYSRDTLLTLNAPTWTLAVQAAFYLVFPMLLLPAVWLRRRAWLLPIALIAIGVFWNWITWSNGWGPIARLALPAMLPYMALGMLMAHLPPASSRARANGLIVLGLVLAIGNGAWHASGSVDWALGVFRDVPGAIGYALIIATCAGPAVGTLRALNPLEAIGRWSYGIFLWHLPILLFIKGQGWMPDTAIVTWLMLAAIAITVGAAEWRFVERPLLARTRGSGGSRRTGRVAPNTD